MEEKTMVDQLLKKKMVVIRPMEDEKVGSQLVEEDKVVRRLLKKNMVVV